PEENTAAESLHSLTMHILRQPMHNTYLAEGFPVQEEKFCFAMARIHRMNFQLQVSLQIFFLHLKEYHHHKHNHRCCRGLNTQQSADQYRIHNHYMMSYHRQTL